MQDNPTLEVLAVVTAVDKISEPAALSAVLFLSIPDFVCFQRRPTPIGDSLGSYASEPKICHAGLGFNQPVFSHQILQSSDAEVNISSYLTFLPAWPTLLLQWYFLICIQNRDLRLSKEGPQIGKRGTSDCQKGAPRMVYDCDQVLRNSVLCTGEYLIPLYIYRGIKDSPVHNTEGLFIPLYTVLGNF